MSAHGLRTTGRPTGNFGRQKVQGKRDPLDLTKEILNKDNLQIPNRDEAFTKLVLAYNTTTDLKLKAALWEMLKRRRATLQPVKVKPNVPDKTHWDLIKLTR
jgi:cell division septal protein FtsQ